MSAFEVGAVARLASGSPLMVVTSVVPAKGEGIELCRCMFYDFKGDKVVEALIPAAALRVAPETEGA